MGEAISKKIKKLNGVKSIKYDKKCNYPTNFFKISDNILLKSVKIKKNSVVIKYSGQSYGMIDKNTTGIYPVLNFNSKNNYKTGNTWYSIPNRYILKIDN